MAEVESGTQAATEPAVETGAIENSGAATEVEAVTEGQTTEGEGEPKPKDGEPGEDGGKAKKPTAKDDDWSVRQITKLRAQRREATERAAKLQSERDALAKALEVMGSAPRKDGGDAEPAKTAPTKPAAEITEEEIERRADARADQKAAQRERNKRQGEIYDAGKSAFPDFDDALKTFGPSHLGIELEEFNAIVEAADETDDPARTLYLLGKNPNELDRIAALPPSRRGAAIVKFAAAAASAPKPKQLSKAPPPPRTIEGGSRDDGGLNDNLSMDEWAARFNKRMFGPKG
jgi:hypothetical protein